MLPPVNDAEATSTAIALRSVTDLIEVAVAELGVDPVAARVTSTEGRHSYSLKRGSARLVVSVSCRDGHLYFRVAAVVLELPAPERREALFRRLLELNAGGLANAAFALDAESVILVSERPTAMLDGEEIAQTIRHVAAVADTFDDRLAREFGGKLGTDAK